MDAQIVRGTELTLKQVMDILEPGQAWASNVHDGLISFHYEADDGTDLAEDIPEDSKFYMELRFNEADMAEVYIDLIPIDWPFEPGEEEDLFMEQVRRTVQNEDNSRDPDPKEFEKLLYGGDTG